MQSIDCSLKLDPEYMRQIDLTESDHNEELKCEEEPPMKRRKLEDI